MYEGDFVNLNVLEDESIANYFQRVDEVANTIKGLGEKVKESIVVQKILKSLPLHFDAKISKIEEMDEFDKLTIDELRSILAAYEMSSTLDQSVEKEEAFGVLKKGEDKESTTSDGSNEGFDNEQYDEEYD